MRWLVLTLAAVLALPSVAAAQEDWSRAYKAGVDAFEKGNDALAEQKLIEARDGRQAPKQNRRATFSGLDIRPFIPDYYLGVIAARQKRYEQAQEILERVLTNKLVTPGDRKEYALATSSLEQARTEIARVDRERLEKERQARLARNETTVPPTAGGNTGPVKPGGGRIDPIATPGPNTGPIPGPKGPGPSPPPPPTEPAWLADFRRAMNASRASLQKARYSEARGSLASATAVAGDAARRQEAAALGREIDSAQSAAVAQVVERARQAIQRKDPTAATSYVAELRGLSPGHAAIAELTRGVNSLVEGLDRTAKLANAERTGVKLFLSGQYQQAADILEQAVNQSLTSPRVYLFLASSRGAQALLAPQDQRPALVDAARRHYALAKPDAGTLTADQRFISPSILQLLNGG
jgi:tetratricopeptide (TPR) repeat protein